MMAMSQIKVAALLLGALLVVAGGGALVARQVLAGNNVHFHEVVVPGAAAALADKKDEGKKDDGKAANSVLDRELPGLNFDKVALGDAVAFLQDVSGMTIDWKAIEDAGVPKDSPVTVKLNNVTLGKAVRSVFEAAGAEEGPQVTAEGKKIVVKPAEKKGK